MTESDTVTGQLPIDHERPLALHPLVYLAEGDEVTIGRPDIDSYGIFPPDGAELVRTLAEGATPRETTEWYAKKYGETVDMNELIACLHELGLVQSSAKPAASTIPVRWRRLGQVMFSPPALITYMALITLALFAMIRRPDLVPTYHHVFFTDYYMIIQVTLFVVAIPQLLLHESFHALAGRRLGVRSSLTISRRLYYIVLETSLDGLVAVPRRKRYLPILAGMLADVTVMAVLVIAADLSRNESGAFTFAGRFYLAFVFAILLRVLWQFSFYLRTDLYVLISTALGCVDLHMTAKRMMRNRINKLLGRSDRIIDESSWHPVDRRVASWYCWLIVIGYTVSIATFVLALVPMFYRLVGDVIERLSGNGVSLALQLDSAVFTAMALLQLVVLSWLIVRDRRRQRHEAQVHHVIA